ncbi:MAG: hypothetical protein SLAVMIC_00945 [uncultured marine phage]|uniref:DUF6576 domain-containing protein n=1 Tax=uncultured marine phage TaxID=707152 RepID=A0A8D9FSJ9_9VIRU|nr:MAG: hypothetical protein SLAVMIC_00945 [uncultured marine phage]
MATLSIFIAGLFFGSLGTIMVLSLLGGKEVKEGKKMLNEIDSLIDSFDLRFHSRVKNFVYINGYKYTIIYMTDINKIAIMEGVRVVLSHQILTEMNEKIATKIKNRFDYEINDVVTLSGVTYSKNIVGGMNPDPNSHRTDSNDPANTKQDKQPIIFNTDTILEKITSNGYDSLSDGEKKWLDDVSKK